MNKLAPLATRSSLVTKLVGIVVIASLTAISAAMNPTSDLTLSPVSIAHATTELAPNRPGMETAAVPSAIGDALPNARLSGEGLLRWFGFRIYQARLFVGEGYNHDRPMQGPIALELTYKRSFSGQSIAERSADEIESLGIGTPAQRSRWATKMAGLFPDINEGDRLAGILMPSGRTLFMHNDKAVGTIDDFAFGPAFFAIWLDERTSAPDLRAQLIGKHEAATPLYESAQ